MWAHYTKYNYCIIYRLQLYIDGLQILKSKRYQVTQWLLQKLFLHQIKFVKCSLWCERPQYHSRKTFFQGGRRHWGFSIPVHGNFSSAPEGVGSQNSSGGCEFQQIHVHIRDLASRGYPQYFVGMVQNIFILFKIVNLLSAPKNLPPPVQKRIKGGMGNIGIAPLPATAHSTILSICILHIRWRVFFYNSDKGNKIENCV